MKDQKYLLLSDDEKQKYKTKPKYDIGDYAFIYDDLNFNWWGYLQCKYSNKEFLASEKYILDYKNKIDMLKPYKIIDIYVRVSYQFHYGYKYVYKLENGPNNFPVFEYDLVKV